MSPRRVLMVTPHFPPDSSAATHRVRLLAPHLPQYGWEPTVVTVDPRDHEGRVEPALLDLVPAHLRVIRCRAWPADWTRRLGIGDLGLRAFGGLRRACVELLERERFDALFITIYPTYPALLGPLLKRRFHVPFVLDYQDPWVGAWGLTAGPGVDGRPDLKSRLTRTLATRLEPVAVRAVDAITAVSARTYAGVIERNPAARAVPCEEIPIGGEPLDFEHLRAHPRANRYLDAADGRVHLCAVGTLLPLGVETLRALLGAVARLRDRRPDVYARLRLWFFGTSNQTAPEAAGRVLPVAREIGVADCVEEIPERIDYLDALTVLMQASAILLLGSSEPHYTASKLYPALLARRPLLALYHEASSVVTILRAVARAPAARLITYSDSTPVHERIESIAAALTALLEAPAYDPAAVDLDALHTYSAEALAERLARVLHRVSHAHAGHSADVEGQRSLP
jgi:glycosyltransferase involved in cell wall biosynthesis